MTNLLFIDNFNVLGFSLNNPIGFVMSLVIAILTFIFYRRIKPIKQGDYSWWWKLFFLLFFLTTLSEGLGQLFFNYSGTYGLIPFVIFAFSANLLGARAMMSFEAKNRTKNILLLIIFLKFSVFLFLALYTGKYMLAYVDAIISCTGYVFVLGLIQFIRSKEKHWLFAFLSVIPLYPTFFLQSVTSTGAEILTTGLSIVSLIFLFIANKQFLKNTKSSSKSNK
jgi:hypothetical protein